MKTRIFSLSGVALALAMVGLLLVTNRIQGRQANPAAPDGTATDTNAVASDVASNTPPVALPSPSPFLGSQIAATNAPSAPPGVQLSKGAADIARLAQSGIGQDVMLAYIGSVNSKFNLGTDQIVYLNDIGVSSDVVKAMIQRDAAIDAAAQAYAASIAPPPVNPNPPPTPADDGSYPPTPDNSTASIPPYDPNAYVPVDDSDYFYTSLAPYGTWIYVAGLGRCWQPTVFIGNHDWRPYDDRGRWLYTDCGWYWQSDYSWGWAAFHYGRWFEEPHHGWVWCPDRVWGSAWVSWRISDQYCGWAPLPPSAHFVPGTGFLFAGHPAAGGFEFGLKARNYTFIPIERMTDYTPARYAVASWQADEVQAQTKLAARATEQNHRVVNAGVDPNAVAAAARTEIRRAEVRDMPHDALKPLPADRLSKAGGSLVIYRSQLPAPTRRATVPPSGRNVNGPKASVTSPEAVHTATTSQTDQLVARIKALQEQAVAHQAAAREAATAETYPSGSLVWHGNGYAGESPQQTSYTTTAATPGWQASSPARSSGGYTVVNGFARPNNPQQTGTQNLQTYVMPGRFTAAQQMSGYSAGSQMNSHAEQIAEAARSQTIPGRYTVAQQLNNEPQHNYSASAPANSHAEQIAEAAQRFNNSEPRTESHAETHVESHVESHASYSAPESHASSSSSSSSSNSSGKR